MGQAETCLRCGEEMRWLHRTWQCPGCLLKLGCCEGEGPEPRWAEADGQARLRARGESQPG